MSETRVAPWHLTASEMDAEWDRLHAKIADLRYQLAERDEEIAALKGHAFDQESSARRRYSNVAPWEIDS